MALLSSILGFSLFGLGARIGQLGIQKRNILESACLHFPPSTLNPLVPYLPRAKYKNTTPPHARLLTRPSFSLACFFWV